MSIELVTGTGGSEHVGSEDFGAYQAYTYGTGRYALTGCDVEMVDANTVRIAPGELLVDGRHVRVKTSEELTLQSGVPGRNRCDLIVLRYTKDEDGIEDAPAVVIPGSPVEGTPQDPPYVNGNILNQDLQVDIPLVRVTFSGMTPLAPELLVQRGGSLRDHSHSMTDIVGGGVLPVSMGGTGATTAAAAVSNLGAAPRSHTHAASDVTSGVLDVARGGTGVNSYTALRSKLGLGGNTGVLPIASGGTSASDIKGARENLGIRTGYVDLTSNVGPGNSKTVNVTFSSALPSIPKIAATSHYTGWLLCIHDVSTTGFQLTFTNKNSSSGTTTADYIAILNT